MPALMFAALLLASEFANAAAPVPEKESWAFAYCTPTRPNAENFSVRGRMPSTSMLKPLSFRLPFDVPGGYANTSQTMETPQLSGQYSREEAVSNTFDLGGTWEGTTRELAFKLGKTRATGGPSVRFGMAAKPRFTTTDAAGNAIGANGNVSSQWSFGNSLNMTFSPQLQESLMNGVAQIDTGSTGGFVLLPPGTPWPPRWFDTP